MAAFPYAALRARSADAAGLIDAVVAQAGQDAANSTTLPPSAYLSQAFFELERDRLFERGWVCIAHVSQLADPDECCVELFGARLGAAKAGDAVVATLQTGDGTPRPLRSEVLDGFVYVNISGDAEPLAPQLAPLSQRLAPLRLDDLAQAFRMDYYGAYNWKILVETFMESYHHAGAHRGTFQVDFPTRLAGVGEHGALWTSGYATARPEIPDPELWTGLSMLSDAYSELERRSFFLYHIYPNQLILTLADRVVWFRSQPVAPDRTRLQIYLLVRPQAREAAHYDAIVARDHAFFTQVNAEDIAANESQQQGLGSRMAEPGRFSHLEYSLWHFATYIRERIGEPPRDKLISWR